MLWISGAKQTCFKELGCFIKNHYKEHTVNYLSNNTNTAKTIENMSLLRQYLSDCPISPNAMNVSFLLFTKDTKDHNISQIFGFNSSADLLKKSKFSVKRRTVFITHGWTDYYGYRPWMQV